MRLFSELCVALLLCHTLMLHLVVAKTEPGITETELSRGNNIYSDSRPLLANSKIWATIECNSKDPILVRISWTITERGCWYVDPLISEDGQTVTIPESAYDKIVVTYSTNMTCPMHSTALPAYVPPVLGAEVPAAENSNEKPAAAAEDKVADNADVLAHPLRNSHPLSPNSKPIYTLLYDGIYNFTLTIATLNTSKGDFLAPLRVEFVGPYGYISAIDRPLLTFYGVMCLVYVIYGIIWLVVSFVQWRDLLRIQFWIGGVILLGMLEKAFFYEQYNTLNNTGVALQGAELAAEFVSCAKRTLARMLVIIMSLGFGIVKPRLGPLLHRVVGVGALYFVLAFIESYLRVMRKPNELLVASIPLAVLDTGICWWIFTSLVQTTRTLRLRRNNVKLTLYRSFTNTLIFSVIASVIFMLYAMHLRKTENCTPGWKYVWLDTAFWHILFSALLLVIMILWRPTNNNQRYAFTPLLDNPEDEDDEEDQFVADAYGVKMRNSTQGSNGAKSTPLSRATTTEEDDLRWVEENIPSSMADAALPVLDSDEEIINTKFEVSKMQ